MQQNELVSIQVEVTNTVKMCEKIKINKAFNLSTYRIILLLLKLYKIMTVLLSTRVSRFLSWN